MSELKYTPGPWFIHDGTLPRKDQSGHYGSFIIINKETCLPGSISIGDVHPYGGGFPEREEAYANAKLISAAPELLEALQEAQKALKGNFPWPELHAKIQAAIDKATK